MFLIQAFQNFSFESHCNKSKLLIQPVAVLRFTHLRVETALLLRAITQHFEISHRRVVVHPCRQAFNKDFHLFMDLTSSETSALFFLVIIHLFPPRPVKAFAALGLGLLFLGHAWPVQVISAFAMFNIIPPLTRPLQRNIICLAFWHLWYYPQYGSVHGFTRGLCIHCTVF